MISEPLTPPDCDLQDFKFMPVDCQRLRDSDLNAEQTPEENWAAFMLWLASWHQVPAASIPDNDTWQAKAAGYVARGRIDKAWESVRAGALRGFIKCSDGRLYHPVVAEKALESWESKQRHAYGRMCERVRKMNKQRTENQLQAVQIPAYADWLSAGKADPVPPEGEKRSAGIPPENALKGQGQGQGQGKKKEAPRKRDATPPAVARPVDVAEQTWADWQQLRKAKKAPVTETVLTGARTESEKAGMPLDAFLQVWCLRGTQGLMADWLQPNERKTVSRVSFAEADEQRARDRADGWMGRNKRAPIDIAPGSPELELLP